MLNDKQKLFLDKFFESEKVRQSAIEAGYSKKTASQIGSRILKREDSQEYLKSKRQLKLVKPKKYDLNTSKSIRIMLSDALSDFLSDLSEKGKTPNRQDLQMIGNVSNILIKSFEITEFEEKVKAMEEASEERKKNEEKRRMAK